MRFDIITIFPDIIKSICSNSIIKRAIENKLIEINIIDFREFSTNKHHTVDDYAYGGGAGMLISVEPVHKALISVDGYEAAYKILTSPAGTKYDQQVAKRLASNDHIIIICGHYEGIDERIIDYVDEEISIGDYILTGGELAAGVLLDSISRLQQGVISSDSLVNESFENNLLEYPQYTHPFVYDNKEVPQVLISGHHANIMKWQRFQSLKKTYLKRPELLDKVELSKEDLKYLEMIKEGKELDL